jgi:hypothetical protein
MVNIASQLVVFVRPTDINHFEAWLILAKNG